MRRRNFLIVVGVFLMACRAQDTLSKLSRVPGNGVHGKVIIYSLARSSHPDQKALIMTGSKPYSATIQILDEQGHSVGELTSNSEGEFRLNLNPGQYTLVPKPAAALATGEMVFSPEQVRIAVVKNTFTEIKFEYSRVPI